MTISPTEIIAVRLDAASWNVILTVLAEAPYKVVAQIIANIQQQCLEFEQQGQRDAASMAQARMARVPREGMTREELREDFGIGGIGPHRDAA